MEKRNETQAKSILQMDVKDIVGKFSTIKKKKKRSSKPKFEMKKTVVAFDIGTSSIKIAVGSYYKNKLSIDKLFETATPDGSIEDGKITNPSALMAALNYTIMDNGIRVKDVICTTNSSSIINRELVIPKVEEDELATVVKYEIQQYLPINLNDYILQTSVLEEIEENNQKKLSVRAISYPERTANAYYELVNGLGLRPYALDVNYNSLNKLINNIGINQIFPYSENGSLAFIDMGVKSIDINIYNRKGILDFTRIIRAGGADIDDALIQRKHSTRKTLEQDKKEKIHLNFIETDKFNDCVKDVADEWIEKIEKVIQFYKNKSFENEISNIILYGGSSNLNGLSQYMADKLGIKTMKISTLPNVTVKPKDIDIVKYINVIGSIIRL